MRAQPLPVQFLPVRSLPALVAAALAALSLLASPARADGPDRTGQTLPPAYPGHWGGPFGMWYGGWQPVQVIAIPATAAQPSAPPSSQGYDREGWLRECRHRLGAPDVSGRIGAEDRARERCEAMLAAPPATYGYAVPVVLVAVTAVAAPQSSLPGASPTAGARPATKTVITEEFYESVPRRTRRLPRRSLPDKRVPQY